MEFWFSELHTENVKLSIKVNKHIFGIIENMSWFTPEEYPDHKYYIFGRGGAEALADKYNLPLLAQISEGMRVILLTVLISAAAAYFRPIREEKP